MRLIAILLVSAWMASAQSAAGHYILRGVHEVGSELLLRPDKTFEYMLAYGAADYTAKGKWQQEGGFVVLSADFRDEPPFRLVSTAPGKTKEVRVRVQGPGGQPVPHIDITLRGGGKDAEEQTSSDGEAIFSESAGPKQVMLRIPVYGTESGPFEVAAGQGEVVFEINGQAITTAKFKGERLKIAKDYLEMTFWDKEKPMKYYKR